MQRESYRCVVLLPHLKVQGANAVSSALSWGFPAPSAFTGFAHALERRVRESGRDMRIEGVGIVCHSADPQVVEGSRFTPRGFRLTRNPSDEEGNSPPTVEEGRVHLTLSLVLTVEGRDAPSTAELAEQLAAELLAHALSMRIAGGSVFAGPIPRHVRVRAWVGDLDDEDPQVRQLLRQLSPGYVLISRDDLMVARLATLRATTAEATSLDALLDYMRLHYDAPEAGEDGDTVRWPAPRRVGIGWLVPVAVGYGAISGLYPAGAVQNVRDSTVSSRFVERVVSIGEWRSPHRIKTIEGLIWRHRFDPKAGVYRVVNESQ